MPTIIDENGEREVSEGELARLSAEGDARFAAFWDALAWRPIGEYDRGTSNIFLLRNGSQWATGFWGDTTLRNNQRGDRWRDAQESMDEAPLAFEPIEFAAVEDRWLPVLLAD